MLNTPILFLIFNRPEVTARVFAAIRQTKPAQLFIAADGPRKDKPGEKELCDHVRKMVLDGVDWECEVKTLFRDENWGCGKSPADAITWFFNQVEQGIILEDDCLPALSFFNFCDELLTKYKDDERVFAISGTNLLGTHHTDASYFFSALGGNWGWASWRRAWGHFDFNINAWQDPKTKDKIYNFIRHDDLYKYYEKIFDTHFKQPVDDVWDYQWLFARLVNNGLSIVPSYNQIKNIGFGSNATHTFDADGIIAKLSVQDISFPLKYIAQPIIDENFDEIVYERFIQEAPQHINIYNRFKNKVKRLIN